MLLVVESVQELDELLHDERCQAERELVDRERARLGHQCSSDRDHLLLAARGASGRSIAELVELRQERVDPLEPLAGLAAAFEIADRRRDDLRPEGATECTEQQVGLDRKAREDLPPLGNLCQPSTRDVVRRLPRHIVASDMDGPSRGANDTADRVEKR